MNESFGAGGFDLSTTGTGSGVQSEAKAEGIAPLLIKQIINSSDDGFKLFGMSFGMITVVGIVRNIEHSSTKITYTLEDYTGQIDAHLWLEEGDIANIPPLLLNTYARVHGSIRNQGGTKAIMLFKIEQLESINGLTSHLLEVLNTRFMAEEYSKSVESSTVSVGSVDLANRNANGGFGINNNFESNTEPSGLKGKQLLVFEAVKNYKGDTGISMMELQSKFSHISSSELHSITDFMTQEGHIYTSIDSDHFLPTDA